MGQSTVRRVVRGTHTHTHLYLNTRVADVPFSYRLVRTEDCALPPSFLFYLLLFYLFFSRRD